MLSSMKTVLLAASLFASLSLDSYRWANGLLERAVAKAGIADPPPLSFHLDGVTFQIEQSRRPGPPYLETDLHEHVFVDQRENLVVHDVTSKWPYFTSRVTSRVRGGELLTIQHARQTHEVRTSGGAAVRSRVARRHPHLLLAAARDRRVSIRAAGLSAFTFADEEGVIVRVNVDGQTMQVTSAEWLSYDPLFGDLALEVQYGWEGGEPVTYRKFENGRLVNSARYRDVRRHGRVLAPLSEVPDAYSAAASAPAPARVELVALGENVELIRNAGGRDYHSLLVRFDDHLVVVEAPFSATAARQAIEAVRGKYPALPIRDLVVTHHHYDHIGGMRAYAEAGARIVTTAGNVEYLRTLLVTPHTIQAAPPLADPEVVAAPSGHRWKDATNELVLFDAGPTDHVEEILVAWLPRQKVLFQGDLYRYDPESTEAARPAAVRLAAVIRERKLDPETIAGVHGEPASPAQMRTAIDRRGK